MIFIGSRFELNATLSFQWTFALLFNPNRQQLPRVICWRLKNANKKDFCLQLLALTDIYFLCRNGRRSFVVGAHARAHYWLVECLRARPINRQKVTNLDELIKFGIEHIDTDIRFNRFRSDFSLGFCVFVCVCLDFVFSVLLVHFALDEYHILNTILDDNEVCTNVHMKQRDNIHLIRCAMTTKRHLLSN